AVEHRAQPTRAARWRGRAGAPQGVRGATRPGGRPGAYPCGPRQGQVRRLAATAAPPEPQPRRQRHRCFALPGQRGAGHLPEPPVRSAMTRSASRLANDAWESLLTAHAALMKRFATEDIWGDVSMREYDVLYTLSKCDQPIRLGELHRHVLLSQPALSRLVERLTERGLIER